MTSGTSGVTDFLVSDELAAESTENCQYTDFLAKDIIGPTHKLKLNMTDPVSVCWRREEDG